MHVCVFMPSHTGPNTSSNDPRLLRLSHDSPRSYIWHVQPQAHSQGLMGLTDQCEFITDMTHLKQHTHTLCSHCHGLSVSDAQNTHTHTHTFFYADMKMYVYARTHARCSLFTPLALCLSGCIFPSLFLVLPQTSYYTQSVHCLVLLGPSLRQNSDTVCPLVSFNMSRRWARTHTQCIRWKHIWRQHQDNPVISTSIYPPRSLLPA